MNTHRRSNAFEEFLSDSTPEEMEVLLKDFDENQFTVDTVIKRRIEANAMEKIHRMQNNITEDELSSARKQRRPFSKRIAVAASVGILAVTVFFAEPVQAAMRELLALIPGIGMVQDDGTKPLLIGSGITTEDPNGLLIGTPSVAATGDGVQIMYSYRIENPGEKIGENNELFEHQKFSVNGELQKVEGMGIAGGSDTMVTVSVYLDASVNEGDTLRYAAQNGIVIESKLVIADKLNPEEIPSDENAAGTVYASVQDSGDNWQIYLYPVGKDGKNIGTEGPWAIDSLYLTTPDGEKVYVTPPGFSGTGLNPPYTLAKGDFTQGTLTIPSLYYTLDEDAFFRVPVPAEGEEISTDVTVEFANGKAVLQRVRLNPDMAEQNGGKWLFADILLEGDTDPIVFMDVKSSSSGAEILKTTEKGVLVRYSLPVEENNKDIRLTLKNPVYEDSEALQIELDFAR